jgi:hypothetical protein
VIAARFYVRFGFEAFANEPLKRFVNIESVARRKLSLVHAAGSLEFLRVPPGNRLEALKGNRAGNTASASMISFVSAFAGLADTRKMSRLSITTKREQP